MTRLAGSVRGSGGVIRLTLVSLAILAVLVLLPNLGPTLSDRPAVEAWHGRVVALLDPHRPDPTSPGGGFLPDARVLLLDGPRAGAEIEAYRQGPGGQQDSNAYRVGDEVVVSATASPSGTTFVAIEDRWRLPQLLVLTLVFAGAVIAVGGWRGARALVGLALSVAILLKVLVPLLVAGFSPIPVAVVVATALTILAVGLTEGLGRSGVAAILGTGAALALTAILAAVVTAAAGFTNTLGSELVSLTLPNGDGLDLRGILLAAFMVGAIGVLDDVTVTQAIAVEELARAGLQGRDLFRSAFGIGRSHIAATVNTLFLAYAGAALPLLIVLVVGQQPPALLLNGETISIEIVRTLVGSIGIVAAVPLTTVIAAWLAAGSVASPVDSAHARSGWLSPISGVGHRPEPAVALVAGLAMIALVAATASLVLGPLTASGGRAPLAPDSFGGPSPSPSLATPSAAPGASAATGPGPEDGPILAVGQAIPLFSAAATRIGSVEVLSVDPDPGPSGRGLTLLVAFRYQATTDLTIDPMAWVVRSTDNDRVTGETPTDPSTHPALPQTVRSGRTVTGWLAFPLAGIPAGAWLDFVQAGESLFAVTLY